MSKVIRIANGQGFWGDSIDAPVKLINDGPIDYLTLDYLAEVTLSIMQRQKLNRPDTGYARDFVDLIDKVLEIGKSGVQIIRYKGLGAMNPEQFWETTMDTNFRSLLAVKIDEIS